MDKRKLLSKPTRRIISDSKKLSATSHRVESPLAKYDATGNLQCIICKIDIKSATLWKVHVNSNNHKLKVEAAKTQVTIKPNSTRQDSQNVTRNVTAAKTNGIEAAAAVISAVRPQQQQQIGKGSTLKTPNESDQPANAGTTQSKSVNTPKNLEELLPEQFFDDPLSDAKVRNVEPKDNQEAEWARFQKEIKEESNVSNAIIAYEQDDFNAKRQLTEIDEQIKKLNKVIEINEKKQRLQKYIRNHEHKQTSDNEDSSSSDGDPDVDLAEWRVKRLY